MAENCNECKVNGVRMVDFYNTFKKLEQQVKAAELKEKQEYTKLLELWNKIR